MIDVETLLTEALHERTARAGSRSYESLSKLRHVGGSRRRSITVARRPWLLVVSCVMAVAAVLAGSLIVRSQVGQRRSLASTGGRPVTHHSIPPFVGLPSTIGAGPYPAADYLVAEYHPDLNRSAFSYVVVRLSDGKVMGRLPDPGANPQWAVTLSSDGTRVYGSWYDDWDRRLGQPDGPVRVGYLDLRSHHFVTITRYSTGDVDNVTVSQNGQAIAYNYDPAPSPQHNDIQIVVHRLTGGPDIHIPHDPVGAIVPLQALSPDGSKLALMPTSGEWNRLLVLNLADAHPLADATVVRDGCPTPPPANVMFMLDNEPQWTTAGLFYYRNCHGGMNPSGRLVRSDATFRHAVVQSAWPQQLTSRTPTGFALAGTASNPLLVIQNGNGQTQVISPHGPPVPLHRIQLIQELGG